MPDAASVHRTLRCCIIPRLAVLEGDLMNKRVLLLCAVICYCSAPLMSQEVSAGITGRVTDPSNAAIVGATVTAKDLDRGTEWPTKTNEDGIYAFPRLPAGQYEVRVEAAGFKTFV